MPRQPVTSSNPDPASGASIGDTENTRKIAAIIRVASAPENMSRTIARGTTPIAAPPSPCTNRPAISPSTDEAIMHSTVPTAKSAIPA